MNYKKVIIDVDTGVDDAIALLYLLKKIPEKILGVTVCAGNTDLKDALNNTLKTLETAGSNIPVYKGEDVNSQGESFINAKDYHGKNGLLEISNSNSLKEQNESAPNFITESAKKYGKDLALICLAPPTNVAKAISLNPQALAKIGPTIMMGGAIGVSGNQTKYSEFNFYQDPFAVRKVFQNQNDVYIVGLDVVNRCFISEQEIEELSKKKNKVSTLVKEIISRWYKNFGDENKRQFVLYDPLTASALTGNFLTFKPLKIGILTHGKKRGMLTDGIYQINVAYNSESESFKKDLAKTINN